MVLLGSLAANTGRLGRMCRSAARELMNQGDYAAAGTYARRAVAEYPWDWKNIAVLSLCTLKKLSTDSSRDKSVDK